MKKYLLLTTSLIVFFSMQAQGVVVSQAVSKETLEAIEGETSPPAAAASAKSTIPSGAAPIVPMAVRGGTIEVNGKTIRTDKSYVLRINDSDLVPQKKKITTLVTPDTVVVLDVGQTGETTLDFNKIILPKGIRSLIITNSGNNIKTIGNLSLQGYPGFNDITFLMSLVNVTTLEDGFFNNYEKFKNTSGLLLNNVGVIKINDKTLSDKKALIEEVLKETTNTVVVLDVGHASAGTLNLRASDLPAGIKRLIITNTPRNIEKIGDIPEAYEGLEDISFLDLNIMPIVNDEFFSKFRNFKKLTMNSLNQIKTIDINDTTLVEHKELIQRVLEQAPEAVVSLDVGHSSAGTLNLDAVSLPAGIRSLIITNKKNNITSIGDHFLSNSAHLDAAKEKLSYLTRIQFLGFNNIISIGNRFLYNCPNLDNIILESMSNVESIGTGFLSFTSVSNLSLPFSKLKVIPPYFLERCSKLMSVDLTALKKVIVIEDMFMNKTGLSSLDLSPFKNVIKIGKRFLGESLFEKIDLSPLENVRIIGSDCLTDCKNLESIDLKGLRDLVIDDGFLQNCIRLHIVTGRLANIKISEERLLNIEPSIIASYPRINLQVDRVRDQVLDRLHSSNFFSLFPDVKVNYTDLKRWTTPQKEAVAEQLTHSYGSGNACLQIEVGSSTNTLILTQDDLPRLPNGRYYNLKITNPEKSITAIGNRFVAYMSDIRKVQLVGFDNVTTIGDDFMTYNSFDEIDIKSLIKVEKIGNNFLKECKLLFKIDLDFLKNLTSVGNNFMSHSTYISSFDFTALKKLREVGDNCLSDCPNLKLVDMGFPSIPLNIGSRFLNRSDSLEFIDGLNGNVIIKKEKFLEGQTARPATTVSNGKIVFPAETRYILVS